MGAGKLKRLCSDRELCIEISPEEPGVSEKDMPSDSRTMAHHRLAAASSATGYRCRISAGREILFEGTHIKFSLQEPFLVFLQNLKHLCGMNFIASILVRMPFQAFGKEQFLALCWCRRGP
jgi:hypothetical protein